MAKMVKDIILNLTEIDMNTITTVGIITSIRLLKATEEKIGIMVIIGSRREVGILPMKTGWKKLELKN
jgi:hypothetical protein